MIGSDMGGRGFTWGGARAQQDAGDVAVRKGRVLADEAGNRAAFEIQRHYCETMGAPITAAVSGAIGAVASRETATGRRILDWTGDPTADALPLRTVGGLHALVQAGDAPELASVFAGDVSDPASVAEIVAQAIARHDAAVLPWLDGAPQTNEPGRSGALMVGLMAVARRFAQPLEILEIGSSAGLNLLIDRYRFDLGGAVTGPSESPVTIRPEWRGPPPSPVAVRFAAIQGVDVAPVDVRNPAAAARLRAYVWADNPQRLERLTRAIAMIEEQGVSLVAGDAADWVEARLAEPQPAGVTRVLMHSVVWQYLGAGRQARIEAAMQAAGARASADRPLAWVKMEPVRSLHPRQEIWVRTWPDGGPATKLAHAQAHGQWVETEVE